MSSLRPDDGSVPEVDRTPPSVLRKIGLNESPYPKNECLECGAVVKMGFFFDAFGRNKEEDAKRPSFYSNVARLWAAHRDMQTRHRPPTHYWYRFYYSGLGADLNNEAREDKWIVTSTIAAKAVGDHVWKKAKAEAKAAAQEIAGIPKVDLKARAKKASHESIWQGSPRPMLQAWSDLRHQFESLGPNAMQVLKGLHPALVIERGTHRLRTMWKDITHRPYKIVRTLIAGLLKGAGQDLVVENVPILRDSSIVAYWAGTGFDTRLEAALRQFREAYDCVKTQMPVRRIEVSIFAADRGAAIARQFTNSLVKTYRRRNDKDLAIVEDGHATQIRIRFMGLFDSVASIMDENLLLDFTPGLGVIEENFSDRQLAVPTAVEQCVHFAAAHELRFYQRLDSLEKTRGEQYLYPGSSGDVTGVNPAGAEGLHAELSRIPLRDMLHRGMIAGSALLSTEELFDYARLNFNNFTLSHPITENGKTYLVTDLVKAYRDAVPYMEGLDFLAHMKVFLRWLAMRYQDPAFRDSMTAPLERYSEERNVPAAENAYNDELRVQMLMSEAERARQENRNKLDELKARLDQCHAATESSRGTVGPPDFRPLWHRLAEEAGHLEDRLRADETSAQAEQEIAARNRPYATDGPQFVNHRMVAQGQAMRRRHRLSDEQAELIRTWQRASKGLDPLPEKVMMLFDALVHDAMLSSWQDHLLASSPLYFRLRDKDTFGATDYAAEAAQRQQDDANTARIDGMPKPVSKPPSLEVGGVPG